MGLFGDLFEIVTDTVSDVVRTTTRLSAAAVALTLGVSERAVQRALDAGCTTVREVEEFLGLD